MAGPLRPNPLPPTNLMAVEILERLKKRFQKSSLFLNGPPALYPYPPPPPLNGPAIKRRTFFCGFPKRSTNIGTYVNNLNIPQEIWGNLARQSTDTTNV